MATWAWSRAFSAWNSTRHETKLGPLSDIPAALFNDIWCEWGWGLFNFLHKFLNRCWLYKDIVLVTAKLLYNSLDIWPIPKIEGIQIRRSGRPVYSTAILGGGGGFHLWRLQNFVIFGPPFCHPPCHYPTHATYQYLCLILQHRERLKVCPRCVI